MIGLLVLYLSITLPLSTAADCDEETAERFRRAGDELAAEIARANASVSASSNSSSSLSQAQSLPLAEESAFSSALTSAWINGFARRFADRVSGGEIQAAWLAKEAAIGEAIRKFNSLLRELQDVYTAEAQKYHHDENRGAEGEFLCTTREARQQLDAWAESAGLDPTSTPSEQGSAARIERRP
jgi:hypothetical protein